MRILPTADAGSLEFPIWDAHVHCYPNEVAGDPAHFAREHEEPHWLNLVTNGPQGWADADELIQSMNRDGIDKALLLGWYWQNPQTCRLQNTWHADWIQQYPDRLAAFAAIHPDDPDVDGQLEAARDWGAVGVGECLPAIQSPEGWQAEGWRRILDWTAEHGWPINLHVTEPVGHVYPGRVETPLGELVEIFETYPSQKWICSHWGGGLPFYSLNKRVSKSLDNVWFDSSASPLLYAAGIWEAAVALVGREKVIFGSDYPLLLDPGKSKKPDWQRILAEIEQCEFEKAVLEGLLFGNIDHLARRRA